MDHDARWLRGAARLVSGMLTTPDDEVVDAYGTRIEGGRATPDEVRALRRVLVLVAEVLTGDAKGRAKRAEMAAQILATLDEAPGAAAAAPARPVSAPAAPPGVAPSPREVPSFMANANRWDAGRAPIASPVPAPVVAPAVVAPAVVSPAVVTPAVATSPVAPPPMQVAPPGPVAPPAPVVPAPAGRTVAIELESTSVHQDTPPVSALPFRRKRPGKPLSLTEYATVVANLGAAGPERRLETLRAHGFATDDEFMAAARPCQEQILADPSLRARFEDVVAAARSRLA